MFVYILYNTIFETIQCLPDSLHDLKHLKLLYNTVLRDYQTLFTIIFALLSLSSSPHSLSRVSDSALCRCHSNNDDSASASPSLSLSIEFSQERTGKKQPTWRIFSLKELHAATNNFNYDNKLGEGGFGSVYWGQLWDGSQDEQPEVQGPGVWVSTERGAFESLICLDMRYQTISIRNGSRQGKGGEISL